jgi:hypothetical protein
MRLLLRRVDLRDGELGASESSSAKLALRAAWVARLRAAVDVPPFRRKVAFARGREVSTTIPGGVA